MLRFASCVFLVAYVFVIILGGQDSVAARDANDPNIIGRVEKAVLEGDKVTEESSSVGENKSFEWTDTVRWCVTGLGVLFGSGGLFAVYRYRQEIRDARARAKAEKDGEKDFQDEQIDIKSEDLESRYKKTLREELGWVKMLGSPDIPTLPVHLLDTFVSLRISQTWRSDERFDAEDKAMEREMERDFSPDEIMQRAFDKRRMLLVIGDPGSGKTTLLYYYAMTCLSPEGAARLGFDKPPLPLYFPLRKLQQEGAGAASLKENLAKWAQERSLDIGVETFGKWLQDKATLVLLDGLDEISDPETRRGVCEWVDKTATGLGQAKFVVTSRWTGYRKTEGIELGFPHVRADVRDFSPEQQEEFLRKWFCAAFLEEQREETSGRREWEQKQRNKGLRSAQAVIDFLADEKNKSIRQLAAVPMLLQIIAVIWKEKEIRPQGRADLYEVALKYLLDFRDRRRNLLPLLAAKKAMRVLSPVSLWMQAELKTDEAERTEFHSRVEKALNPIDEKLHAPAFCENLRNRAGVIAEYGENAYIFRHKSFREYLAGCELVDVSKKADGLKQVVKCFGDDWWEEPLRFYIGEADAEIFDGFMDAFFASERSADLDQKHQNLLNTMVCEAGELKIDSLVRRLNDGRTSERKKRYILDCLKAMDREDARAAINDYAEKEAASEVWGYADEIAAELAWQAVVVPESAEIVDVFARKLQSFRNPLELNAEYILIPGGTYKFQGKTEKKLVADLYFAKYPLTNKRYRRFIRYLAGVEEELARLFPRESFAERLLKAAEPVDGFAEYLGKNPAEWPQKLRSPYDNEKRFKGDDQPVIGVSWFDATAYCLWLSLLDVASKGIDLDNAVYTYRLPKEVEWEWAAGGGLRKYPWPDDKGPPTDKLANYAQNVGATTPVGRYPEGATPQGLMDMAGNVWEWMENLYGGKDYRTARCLRGGSWGHYDNSYLRCSFHNVYAIPGNRGASLGFRVVFSQS